MKNLFLDSRALDSAAREKYSLTEEIMMENAAMDLGQAVYKALELTPGGAVAVLCGSGNNGADGYAFARRSMGRLRVTCIAVSAPKSELCKGQASRAAAAGVPVVPFDPEMTCGSASSTISFPGRKSSSTVSTGAVSMALSAILSLTSWTLSTPFAARR